MCLKGLLSPNRSGTGRPGPGATPERTSVGDGRKLISF